MKKLLLCLLAVGTALYTVAQTAAQDAPNLDFSMGNFAGWECSVGKLICDNRNADDNDKTYHYEWDDMPSNVERIKLFGDVDTEDPILQCDEFYINPDPGKMVARIGVPQQVEGYGGAQDYAAAERLRYSYKITPATCILKYRFAAVLHLPDETPGAPTSHFGPERPYFGISIEVVNQDGTISVPTCSAYSTVVNSLSQRLQKGTAEKNGVSCTASAGNPANYMFQPWTSALVDLRQYIGSTVTITVITHDCFFRQQNSTYPYAGSHEAYGYFRAEAMDMNLSTRVCNSQEATIAAPTGYAGYQWSRSDHFAIQANDPNVPNVVTIPFEDMVDDVTYQCELTDELGCAAIDLKTQLDPVTLVPKFSYEAKCGGEVQFFDESVVSGDNLVNWMWTVGEGETTTNVSNHIYSEPGDYEVKLTATTSNGCQESFSQTVHVPYFPDLSITAPNNVCEGKEINISVSNVELNSRVEWKSSVDAYNQVISESEAFVATPEQTQTYKVTVTDPRGCVYEKPADVTLFGKTPVHIVGETKACPNEAVELTLVGERLSNFMWNVSGSANQSAITVYPYNDATYIATAQDEKGCTVEAKHDIEVLSTPTLTVDVPAVCAGQDAVVTATGANSYQWQGIQGATTGGVQTIPQPTNGQEYTVIGYTQEGCSDSKRFVVNVKQIPEIEVTGLIERCAGEEPFVLEAIGAVTYKWNGVEGDATFTAPSDVQQTVRVIGINEGCESAPKEVTLTPLPLPVIEAITPYATICEGNETTLKVAGAYSYQWQGVSDDADYLLVSPVEDKVYTVRGVSEKGCYSDPIDIPVMVRYADQVKAHIEKIIACPGKPDSAIVVAEGALSYKWSSFPENEYVMNNQSDRLVVLYDTPTTITVEGTNEYACNSTAQVSLARMPVPTLEFKVEPEWIDAANPTVRLTGMAPNNEVTWWWNVGDGSALLQARDTMHTYQIEKFNQPFVVEVTAIDQYGCRFEGEAQVHIWKDVWSPTAFTPNGDGLNDVFGFYGVDEVEEFLFYIYNRLGEVVFEGHSADDTWDGTYQGKPCPWGVYGWVAQYRAVLNGVERQETLRGQVSIVK